MNNPQNLQLANAETREPDMTEINMSEQMTREEAQNLCLQLFNTTQELITLLDQETNLLRKAKTEQITPFHVRKDALTATLSHHMTKFKSNADLMRQLAPDELQSLQLQKSDFQKSLESNHAALSAMQAVSERILQTVATKLSKKQGGPEVYNAGGHVGNAGVTRRAAINIDTAL